MTEKNSRYIDPLTDYGFKRLFGSEPDKDIMIEFLNALFEGENRQIKFHSKVGNLTTFIYLCITA
ncbi:PD-(D/E)XK nuclease family transposase [Pedobacter heparinus]|uniref:PD-(D/E)XK nuclease family transposase n=1 Tax=Pedobacter heparinus TaxID=984 RepID=UPI002931AE7F|nr:PD-(D/E)XK nuclease family transposase [Pedobacter heparinus]